MDLTGSYQAIVWDRANGFKQDFLNVLSSVKTIMAITIVG
jgi:hypothetical protein